MDTSSRVSMGSNSTLVVVRKSPRLNERESLEGSRNDWSRLPQYLIRAMFGKATAVAFLVSMFLCHLVAWTYITGVCSIPRWKPLSSLLHTSVPLAHLTYNRRNSRDK